MGYFNYFIKCIIRNIAYRLCKPKILLTILLAVAILFGLKHFGYCSDMQLETIIDQLEQITENQSIVSENLETQLINISNNTNTGNTYLANLINQLNYIRQTQLPAINNSLDLLKNQNHADLTAINSQLLEINNMLTTVNSSINTIISTINENHDELLTELDENNNAVISELTKIQDILTGTQKVENQNYQEISGVRLETNGNISTNANESVIYFPYEQGSTYNITIKSNYASNVSFTYIISGGSSVPSNGVSSVVISQAPLLGGSSFVYRLPSSYNFKYIYIRKWPDVSVTVEKVTGQTGLNNIDSSINQGNQLQQEQNDLIKDDNVNTDNFEFATNDTNNPTEEGFNTLFTSIYNAFCNTSSAPLTVTLPYINETLTIQPNLVSNAMNKMRFRGCGNFDSVFLLLWCLFVYI